MRIRTVLRTPKARVALIGVAVAIAAVAAWGGPGAPAPGGASGEAAIAYVRDHRVDLGAPGLAATIVHGRHETLAASGDVTTATPFIIGSATKSFTALAVLQLAEAG